jgi:hypothetical protein
MFLSVSILVYSTILQFSVPSIVLCFGNDGHIAFEQTDDNNECAKNGNDEDYPIHKHKNLSHQEDDCQDIPLMTVLSTLYLEKDGKIKTVKFCPGSAVIKYKNTNLVSHFGIHKENTILYSSMKSLQATVLLI